MISRPTTDQLIEDVCRELVDEILPALDDETLRVRIVMAEVVLRNAAVRAAHEIAWLTDEAATQTSFASRVAAGLADAEVGALVADVPATPASLHLGDVVERYERASRAFAAALSAAQDAGATELVTAGRELLDNRVATEKLVMASYSVVGR